MDAGTEQLVRSVRDYYNEYGWRVLDDGRLTDVALFVDRRQVSRAYRARERRRDRALLPPRGQLFLDAASGALPYTDYSSQYASHVCVDISITGLREARDISDLGARGRYVNADLRHLPFASAAFDAVISAHTLYHIPAQGQSQALAELIRVLASQGTVLVLYSNVDSLSYRVKRVWERVTRREVVPVRPTGVPRLFSQPLAKDALEAVIVRAGGYPTFRCHSFMSRQMLQRLIPNSLLGRWALGIVYSLESAFPSLAMPLGQYFSIQIRKCVGDADTADG